MNLTKLSETASKITLGWTPVPGAIGYRFQSAATAPKWSHTWDATRSQVTFSKADWYKVEALGVTQAGEYPAPEPPPPPPPPPVGNLPAIITSGGTYSGQRTGTVQIRTSAPVVIENSSVTISGGADYIDANHAGVQLTLRRCTFSGGTGRVFANGFKSVVVENCTIDKGWGIRLDSGQTGCTVLVTRNKIRNITWDGSNPSGLAHAFQIAYTRNAASVEVSWNEVINVLGQSRCEDVFSSYASNFVKFHDNYIRGAYPLTVTAGYSGGGIIVDGKDGHDNECYDNIVVDTVNYGVAIAGGMNNRFHDNRVVFDGKNDAGQTFAAANIGVYVADFSSQGATMTGNQMWNNVIGWMNAAGARNDAWTPKCQGQCSNQSLKSGAITKADEDAEWQRWLSKLAAAGVTVGA